MNSSAAQQTWPAVALTMAFLAALYIALYQLNMVIMGTEAFAGVASIVFLPAFVRLLGFLLVGLWTIPALFLAAWWCVDLGLDPVSQTVVALALSVGAPLALWIAKRVIGIEPTLANLNGTRLLALSMVAALGSGVAYHFGLSIVRPDPVSIYSFIATILGDAAGTWIIIYAIKTLLNIFGRFIPTV